MDLLTRPARTLGLPAGLAAALLLAGCSGDGDDLGSGAPATTPTTTPTTASTPATTATGPSPDAPATTATDAPESGGANAPLLAAATLVVDRVAGSRVLSVESDNDDDDDWEVTVVDTRFLQSEASVSPDGTRLLTGPSADPDDDNDDVAETRRLVGADQIGFEAAVRAVEGAVAGGRISEINLDTWRGRVVWEADVTAAGSPERGVRIDPGTGRVLSNGPSSQDDDD